MKNFKYMSKKRLRKLLEKTLSELADAHEKIDDMEDELTFSSIYASKYFVVDGKVFVLTDYNMHHSADALEELDAHFVRFGNMKAEDLDNDERTL